MSSADQVRAAPAPNDGERATVLFMEHTKSADDAAKYGVLYVRVLIQPTTIKTYFGELEVIEAWLERRPHPEVLKIAIEKGEKKREHFTQAHFLLCIRHRPLTVEESTFGGVWFTSDEEWAGFSMADREVRQFRFWAGEPTELSLTVVRIHDLDLSGRRPKPSPGKGIMQILRLKKKEPNQAPEPPAPSGRGSS